MNRRWLMAVTIALAGTLGTGYLHGRMTNRWGLRQDAQLAAEQLRVALPAEAGPWRLRREEPFPRAVVQVLQCPAHISRVYEHPQTGDVVTVAVIVGPPGPVSVHSPKVCYSSRDYTIDGPCREVAFTDAAGQTHTLWELSLKVNDLAQVPLKVLYGWSTGQRWQATSQPRFRFGGLSHLYKLQLSVTQHPASEAIQFDAAEDFLNHFLAQLQPRLVPAQRGLALR